MDYNLCDVYLFNTHTCSYNSNTDYENKKCQNWKKLRHLVFICDKSIFLKAAIHPGLFLCTYPIIQNHGNIPLGIYS